MNVLFEKRDEESIFRQRSKQYILFFFNFIYKNTKYRIDSCIFIFIFLRFFVHLEIKNVKFHEKLADIHFLLDDCSDSFYSIIKKRY